MQQSFNREILNNLTYLVGNSDIVSRMPNTAVKKLFDEDICEFLNDVSKFLMKNPNSRQYSDVITLGYWIRKSSVVKLKERLDKKDGDIHLGRGVAFHIAPSNVPVNFAYSLFAGLMTGNCNIVRVPSKEFPQVEIITEAIKEALNKHQEIKPYIVLVRYDRNKEINDLFSSITDTRIVWGGDATIAELRKSFLSARSTEITFADRYSLAIIDSDVYVIEENKEAIAQSFYNDTYFSDQNACTSPRLVVWTGNQKNEAKEVFWSKLHELVQRKYTFQAIQGINKLTSSYLIAAQEQGIKIEPHNDNLMVRVKVSNITNQLVEWKDNSGYFFEYDCDDLMELKSLCNDKRCQTIAFLGSQENLMPLLTSGIKGIDRVVPIGKTMDFDFIWDGYDLISQLTRIIKIVEK